MDFKVEHLVLLFSTLFFNFSFYTRIGDHMKVKNILFFGFSILIGVSFSFLVFYGYGNEEKLTFTGLEKSGKESVYFLQQGVYSSKESMEENTLFLTDYIYEVKDSKYYVYVGITKNLENSEKIKGFYEKNGYILYRKSFEIQGLEFIEKLEEYDELLKNAKEDSEISLLCKQILTSYKELIIDAQDEGSSEG